ncbi:MAG TPA: hypothetical protein VMQ62_12165 [Dongiaceae bacterium]|nr:hypothetical protein [Dongiaceae bacterium]
MTSRWSVLLVLVAVAGIALAGASPVNPSQPTLPASPAVSSPAAVLPEASTVDPWLEGSAFDTHAPEPMVGCQMYAWQCVEDGGSCGPQHQCFCLFHPGTGWICAR